MAAHSVPWRPTHFPGSPLGSLAAHSAPINSSSKIVFNKNASVKKSIVLPLPEAIGSTQHTLASLVLRLWPHMIITALHKHRAAAEIIGSREAHNTQRSAVSVRPYPSLQTAQKTIPIKITSALTIHTAQRQTPNRAAVYPPSSVFPHRQLHLTSCRSSFDMVAAADIDGH